MEIEYEAKFLNVDKTEVRERLAKSGAKLVRPEFLQKRWVFALPLEKRDKKNFMRVRDEGSIITMTWKQFSGAEKDNPQEIELVVDSFEKAIDMLAQIGCVATSFQESYRELWHLDDAKITIDTWPFYEPFVEIEGTSEEIVENASKKTGFVWNEALFCGVSKLFKIKYGEDVDIRDMPKLTFDMGNPFA